MINVKNSSFNDILNFISNNPFKWVVTGASGFIGSNIVEILLDNNQSVVGVDNHSTGKESNILNFLENDNFTFINNDLSSIEEIKLIIDSQDFMLHQAALGSVPRSIKEPLLFHNNNIGSHLNILEASNTTSIKGIVYASSSSVYGDDEVFPKKEDSIGNVLSPYALTKKINEEYAKVYYKIYQVSSIGLRYFNVFGKRQDPDGQYAAVIPKWISAVNENNDVNVNGDGSISRDFCYINNVIEMNIRSALIQLESRQCDIFNVACGKNISLNQLLNYIKKEFDLKNKSYSGNINYLPPRQGDIQDSLADIDKAINILGYSPDTDFEKSLNKTISWYLENG